MAKTYSVCFLVKHKESYLRVWPNAQPYWVTNWYQYYNLDDIDFNAAQEHVNSNEDVLAWGYVYGHNSRNITSEKNRTVVYTHEKAMS